MDLSVLKFGSSNVEKDWVSSNTLLKKSELSPFFAPYVAVASCSINRYRISSMLMGKLEYAKS
jgi:hypothetical protein